MNAALQQETLKQLARYLQAQLQPQAQQTPLQVQCIAKDGLMVLVQHPPGSAPNPQAIFQVLEQTLGHLPLPLANALLPTLGTTKANLFLRVLGQQKPYTFHHVRVMAESEEQLHSVKPLTTPAHGDDRDTVIQSNLQSDQPNEYGQAAASDQPAPQDVVEGEFVYPSTETSEMAQSSALVRSPKSAAELVPKRSQRLERSLLKPLLFIGGGVAAVLVLAVGGYALTRPCVVGGCQPLETATNLGQQSAQTLQSNNTEAAAQQALQQVQAAQRLVEAIPPWSGHYAQAQAMTQGLDQVLAAEAAATEATQTGQVATQTVTDWQATQSRWQEAIASMQKVPSDHPFHAYAQQRLANYQANLTFINQRIAGEADAQKRILAAKKTAELAIARQNTAEKLNEWQVAASTWQVAVNTLNQVPKDSTSYTEAQQLLESYQPKLVTSRDRATKEQQASNAYAQATQLEQQAKTLQQKNQWSQAMASWRSALNYAKRIPNNTSMASQGQNLVATYTSAIKQAETVVKLRGDLDKICFASGRICTYTITNESIRLEFLPAYERKVRTLGGLSYLSEDYNALAQINKHFATLQDALQTVSNNAGLPVQVYNSDKQLVGSFVPGLE